MAREGQRQPAAGSNESCNGQGSVRGSCVDPYGKLVFDGEKDGDCFGSLQSVLEVWMAEEEAWTALQEASPLMEAASSERFGVWSSKMRDQA